jgi:hypothetical protein
MNLLAHHAGEQALAPLLLLGGGGISLLLAIGRARMAALRPSGKARRRPETTDRVAGS